MQKIGERWESPGAMAGGYAWAGAYACIVLMLSWPSANGKCWRWAAGLNAPFFETAQPFLCCPFIMTNLMAGAKGIDAKQVEY